MVSGTVFSVYSVLWGSLFCGVTLIHLIACAGKFDVVRRVTKVCVMPLLALWYSVLFPGGYTVLWALIFGTVGDILLLQPYKRTAFLAGLLAFFVGHIFWIVTFSGFLSYGLFTNPLFIALLAVYGIVAVIFTWFLKIKEKVLCGAVFVYTVTLEFLNFISVSAVLITKGTTLSLLFLAGTSLFLLSDSILALTVFRKDITKKLPVPDFWIMFTYIAAQVCLAFTAGMI